MEAVSVNNRSMIFDGLRSAMRERYRCGTGTQGGSGLVGERHGGEQLIAPHLGAGLGNQHVAAETTDIVFDLDA